MSKRAVFSQMLRGTGLLRALEMLPSRPGILIINHHRIGDASRTRFDQGVFSETQEGLSRQITAIRRRMPILHEGELEELVLGRSKLKRMHAVITFDDGYLDNYKAAFPVLQAHGCSAIFFLVTQFVGSDAIPWWDEIAYLVRTSTSPAIVLHTPEKLRVVLTGDRNDAIRSVLLHYKRADNVNGAAFLEELRQQANCSLPQAGRRFLSWDEARIMQRAGMSFGSHTRSHPLLSQLNAAQQRSELLDSKLEIEQQLQISVRSLAYPVGISSAFTNETEAIAQTTGYAMSFAFAGGINLNGAITPTHLQRTSLPESHLEARTSIALLATLGRLPYS